MIISRRKFLELCRNSAPALGLGAGYLARLESALANPNGPTVIWLQGSACTGCSVSLLNRISTSAADLAAHTSSIADTLINVINLVYHPNLMTPAGESAATVAARVQAAGGYILAVEGGVPTAFGGCTCWAWTSGGRDVTFLEAVTSLAARADQVLALGTCAAFGGIPAAPPNPAGVKTVKAVTLRNTLNIPGCPPHPDWILWAIANLLTNSVGTLDSYGRPAALFSRSVHSRCPRRERDEAHTYGQDNRCLEDLGCYGPDTKAPCPVSLWNNRQNWCVDANSQCIGCTEPRFPFMPLRRNHDD